VGASPGRRIGSPAWDFWTAGSRFVTGAGRGIGRGEALELAREGARVVVNELDTEAGQAVVDEIVAAGGEAVLDAGDCSEDDTARALVARAVDTWGRLDALVNNAGILRDRTVAKMSVEEWDSVVKVHLRGHFLPTHHACAYWKDVGTGGRIVCTASSSGLLGNFGQANYGAAKAGIAAFSTIVAMEMARYGVRCIRHRARGPDPDDGERVRRVQGSVC
jgi:NAD(P)-dependent dehydrogenase (short-subunit alcohol dehydrogenase family)